MVWQPPYLAPRMGSRDGAIGLVQGGGGAMGHTAPEGKVGKGVKSRKP